jgi:hypothetical protein
MKKTVKLFAILALVTFTFAANAQSQKFGHVDFAKFSKCRENAKIRSGKKYARIIKGTSHINNAVWF